MLRFMMDEVLTYYDGIQLAFMSIGRSATEKFLVAQSLDDEVFLASRVSAKQVIDLRSGTLDVKTAMKNPHKGEFYILLDPILVPTTKPGVIGIDEYFSIPVQYDPVFDRWAIPSSGLFLTDL